MTVTTTDDIYVHRAVTTGGAAAEASLEELLAFERLLFDLSARFANVAGEQVVAEIESALKQLLKFLGFDRSTFSEFTADGKQDILCSVQVEGVEPHLLGAVPAYLSWFVTELRSGHTIVIRSYEDFPPEAAAAAEYYRRVGIRFQLVIPISVGGRIVASIGFGSFRSTREWPDECIARVKVIGEVMAQALIRKRSEAADASLAELLRFERLTADLSVGFANVSGDQVETEIENALRQLLEFLDFDRGGFGEFNADGWYVILCSVGTERAEPFPPGPAPAFLSWYFGQLRADKILRLRSINDLPPEATGEIDYFRRSGIRSSLAIPLRVGGHVVGAIAFSAFHSTREWPDELIARLKIIGEGMAQAVERKRSEAALQASEERWRSIFETSTIGITIFDQDLHYMATNQAFRALLGYTDEELRQLTPADITVGEEREAAQSRLADLQQGKVNHYEVVKQYRRKDGKVLWAHSSVAQVAESRPKIFIGTTIDITESKQAEDAVEATRAELRRAARMNRLGALTASIAHEINQPLAAIAANTSAALRWLANTTPNLDEARAALEGIGRDSQRAADVVEGIRAMFKNDSQNRVLLDINQPVREVLVLVQGELFKRGISLDTELAENLPQVMADRVQLQQVVMNLVTNAMDAMEPIVDRQKLLRVKSAIRDGDIVVVAIEDSGTGIDADKVDRLFDTFFTTKPNGMGMGLSICRSIIEAHNGRLGVSAGAQYGSVFWFELPTK
jgi:PAS domain S-box-containing protein